MFGFGNALGIRAYGSGFGHRLAIGSALRLRAWVYLRRLALAYGIRSSFAYGLASGITFGLGHSLWLSACGLASGVFAESIMNAGMPDSFGIVQFSGTLGEKRKYCKGSRKELDARN